MSSIYARQFARSLGALLLVAKVGQAQNPPPVPPARTDTVRDSIPKPPPTLPVNGQLLRAQHLRYELAVISPDSTHIVGQRNIDLRMSSYDSLPAWRIVETRSGIATAIDTLFLTVADLRPLHWSSLLGPARMTVDFTPDSIIGSTAGPPGRQSIHLANRGDLLVGAPMTEVVLQAMPLAVGRQDSVTVLLIDLGQSRIVPAALAVDGEEDVVTPQGRVHCWVVTLRAGDASSRFWVSEADRVVVRTRQELPGRPGVQFEQRLMERR